MKKLITTGTVILCLTGCISNNKNTQKENKMTSLETPIVMEDTKKVTEVIISFFKNVDNRKWQAIAQQMTDSVYVD